MKKTILGFLALFVAGLTVFPGCAGSGSGALSEGIIEYEAAVLNKDNPLASFAPSKMTFSFKNSVCRGELTAGMGMLNTAFISDPEAKTLTQLVRLVTQKFAHVYDYDEVKKETQLIPEFTLKKTEETKIIAGYPCKRAVLDFKDENVPDFDVYYTNEIAIESPNWGSHYHEIEGVLMEYQVERYGMNLRLVAKNVKHSAVEEEQFQIPEGYKKVPAAYLTELFESFQ